VTCDHQSIANTCGRELLPAIERAESSTGTRAMISRLSARGARSGPARAGGRLPPVRTAGGNSIDFPVRVS